MTIQSMNPNTGRNIIHIWINQTILTIPEVKTDRIRNLYKILFDFFVRYANGKVYGSESDYGSEYGSGQGKGPHSELQHENGGRTEASDMGTYQAQTYQQSTLSRNRH